MSNPILKICVIDIAANMFILGSMNSSVFCRNGKGFFIIPNNDNMPMVLHLGYKPQFIYDGLSTANPTRTDYRFETA